MGLSRRIGLLIERLLTRFLPATISDIVGRCGAASSYTERAHSTLGRRLVYLALRSILPHLSLLVGRTSHRHGPRPALFHVFPTHSSGYRVPAHIYWRVGRAREYLVGLFGGLGFPPEVSTAMSLLGYVAGITQPKQEASLLC